MFGGYVVILLIGFAAAVFVPDPFVPDQGITAGDKLDSKVLQKEDSDLQVAALEGKIDQFDSKWKKKEFNFAYQGKLLNIVVPNNESSDVLIVADRKGTNDDQIEASYYKTRATMNDREITRMLPQIDVKLVENQLTIQQEKNTLKYSQFMNVFPIRQFTGDSMYEHSASFSGGQSIIYLRIPKDLQLNPQENLNFEYVAK